MKKPKYLFIPIILILIVVLVLNYQKNFHSNSKIIPTPKTEVTEVTDFSPADIPSKSESGSCWTNSIASSESNAYRCTVGNFIFDPCFETQSKRVVCVSDPEKSTDNFELKLTKPLPDPIKRNRQIDRQLAWTIILDDENKCFIETGTADSYNNNFSYYYCNNSDVHPIGFIDDSQPLWKMEVVYSDPNNKTLDKFGGPMGKEETHTIIKAWE